MAEQAKAQVKKEAKAKVAAPAKKAPVKKDVKKGEILVCDVCGMGVTVAQVGDVVLREHSVLLCCGEPMHEKAAAKKATKPAAKKAAKPAAKK